MMLTLHTKHSGSDLEIRAINGVYYFTMMGAHEVPFICNHAELKELIKILEMYHNEYQPEVEYPCQQQ